MLGLGVAPGNADPHAQLPIPGPPPAQPQERSQVAGGPKGAKLGDLPEGPPSNNLYISGLPHFADEKLLREVFGQNIARCRVLPCRMPGQGSCVGQVQYNTIEEASFVRDNMNNQIIRGWEKPVTVRYNANGRGVGANNPTFKAQGKGRGAAPKASVRSSPYGGGTAGVEEQDTVFVKGLPFELGLTDELLLDLFENYGLVTQCKVMPSTEDNTTGSALVQYFDEGDAAMLVNGLNGFMPPGCSEPLVVDLLHPKPKSGPFAMFSKKLKPVGEWYNEDDFIHHHAAEPSEPAESEEEPAEPSSAEAMLTHLRPALPGNKADPGGSLMVQGLPTDCDDLHLFRLCTPFGAIMPDGVKVEKEEDETCGGFGVVDFVSQESAKMAELILNGSSLGDGSCLTVVAHIGGSMEE